jgi:hypothetical protein
MTTHTGGTWRTGKDGGSVVTDAELASDHDRTTGHGHVEYYGGLLIAESIARQNIPIVSAAPDLLRALKAWREFEFEFSSLSWDQLQKLVGDAIGKAEGRS